MLFNDVFGNDAFNFINITEGVMQLPYVESMLGEMGLFDGLVEGVETDTIAIDLHEGQLQILTDKPRGTEPERMYKDNKKRTVAVKIPHLNFEDRVSAASLLGKRRFGQDNVLESVAEKVNDRFTKMLQTVVAPTLETHRLGALRGVVLNSDGTSVIHDYFTTFNETQITVDFALSNASTNIREECIAANRQIEDELGGVPFTGITAICGRNFFDEFTAHPKVRDTYLNQEASQGAVLRADLRRTGFLFGGIMWMEYRGMRNLPNDLGKVNDDEAIMFPEGVSDMFRTYYAPADYLETVNTLGQAFYAKVAPDWKYNRWVDQMIESNPLFINTRPRAVLKVTKS